MKVSDKISTIFKTIIFKTTIFKKLKIRVGYILKVSDTLLKMILKVSDIFEGVGYNILKMDISA